MNPTTTRSSPKLLVPLSNILVATHLLDETRSSLQNLCSSPDATMQRRWQSQVGLLRLELDRIHITLSSLYGFLANASDEARRTGKAIDGLPAMKTIEKCTTAISATARDSLIICSEALTDLRAYRSTMIGGPLHSRECDKFEALVQPQLRYIKTHRNLIQDARYSVEKAAYASRDQRSFIVPYLDIIFGTTAKAQTEVTLMTMEKHFWQSPFRLDFTFEDSSTGHLASELLKDYRSPEKLKKLEEQFANMGIMWGKGRKNGRASTEPTNGELEEVYSTLCGNIRDGLKAYLLSKPPESSSLTQDTSNTIDHLGHWHDHKHFGRLTIAIGGGFSHGKSSFLNAIMGERVLPSSGVDYINSLRARLISISDIYHCYSMPHYAFNGSERAISADSEPAGLQGVASTSQVR